MRSIAEVQRKLKEFDHFARDSDDTKALSKKWRRLFDTDLTEVSAKSFVAHYREMRSKSTRGRKINKKTRRGRKAQRGGSAPLNYVMTPGADVSVYGRFPVEVDTDPGSIKDLDVYFQNALTLGCGNNTEFWPTVPANMGSNQVGGARRTNRNRKGCKGRNGRKGRNTMRHRRQRGGDIIDDFGNWVSRSYTGITNQPVPTLDPISRPMFATVFPNAFQQSYSTATGMVPDNYPQPPEPEKRAWDFTSKGISMAIPPQNVITSITADFNKATSPALYSSSDPNPVGSVRSYGGPGGGPVGPGGTLSYAGAGGIGSGSIASQISNLQQGALPTRS
jgi:hypothetical protein